jgi:type IV pilus assembly protein PilB
VLVTGPTGSGKSTTLYAGLELLNKPDRTLITIEDPVEYEVDGVKQVQVNPRTGLTFAKGLRAMMRADPDVLLVGEIRDRETAQIAVEAALTGHLVLSTLHTNDAPTSIIRLIEMGIEPFLVASGIDCVIAQRLVRVLCECKTEVRLTAEALRENGFPADSDIDAFEPAGCVRCGQMGYRGRVGLYEVMPVSKKMRELVLESRPADEIASLAEEEGMTRLLEDGFAKVKSGMTSVDEVLRVLGT